MKVILNLRAISLDFPTKTSRLRYISPHQREKESVRAHQRERERERERTLKFRFLRRLVRHAYPARHRSRKSKAELQRWSSKLFFPGCLSKLVEKPESQLATTVQFPRVVKSRGDRNGESIDLSIALPVHVPHWGGKEWIRRIREAVRMPIVAGECKRKGLHRALHARSRKIWPWCTPTMECISRVERDVSDMILRDIKDATLRTDPLISFASDIGCLWEITLKWLLHSD